MLKIWAYTLISVVIVSLVSLIGVFTLSLDKEKLNSILKYLVSFAVGGLFGDAFIHLLPQSFEKLGYGLSTSLYIVLGLMIFFVLEKFLRWRHCHHVTTEQHIHPVVTMNLVSDAVHNMIDGMIIAASYIINIPLGIATTLAVVFHELPQEIGDFGILIFGGLKVRKALYFNFLTALTSVLGALIVLIVGPFVKEYTYLLLPITAGGFIYIAGSDLIPVLHEHDNSCDTTVSNSVWQFLMIILGVALMALLTFLE
ncbi:MAG: ZIP family metal transporter [Elusimicrobia bacterium]|nr:ZIP family metal transporter [Elusimicrobiota bacterium]MBU2615430.1 ZIP family metal transporter [Elusimicrobiota bacterium]